MRNLWFVWTIFAFLPLIRDTASGQQPPQGPKSFSIVLNDSTESMTIEFLSGSEWQQLKVEPGKDANIKGDRIRVATNRDDKAVITVDLPIQGGKKYRLAWNARSSMWDFGPAQ